MNFLYPEISKRQFLANLSRQKSASGKLAWFGSDWRAEEKIGALPDVWALAKNRKRTISQREKLISPPGVMPLRGQGGETTLAG